jgi:hypothetical protein
MSQFFQCVVVAGNGLPIVEEGSSNILPELKNGKERNWVAINVGTLATDEERMLECIHVKPLASCVLI